MGMFSGARASADKRLSDMGMPADGGDPIDMMVNQPAGDPMVELEQVLAQIPPEIAQQVMAIVAKIAGPKPESPAEEMAEHETPPRT